jgi:hypothetical protein
MSISRSSQWISLTPNARHQRRAWAFDDVKAAVLRVRCMPMLGGGARWDYSIPFLGEPADRGDDTPIPLDSSGSRVIDRLNQIVRQAPRTWYVLTREVENEARIVRFGFSQRGGVSTAATSRTRSNRNQALTTV